MSGHPDIRYAATGERTRCPISPGRSFPCAVAELSRLKTQEGSSLSNYLYINIKVRYLRYDNLHLEGMSSAACSRDDTTGQIWQGTCPA